jgi:hypothetical protein
VTLNWAAASNASSYNVYYSANQAYAIVVSASNTNTTQITGINGTSTTITGLTNGTTYYFIVTAYSSSMGEGPASNMAWATPTTGTMAPITGTWYDQKCTNWQSATVCGTLATETTTLGFNSAYSLVSNSGCTRAGTWSTSGGTLTVVTTSGTCAGNGGYTGTYVVSTDASTLVVIITNPQSSSTLTSGSTVALVMRNSGNFPQIPATPTGGLSVTSTVSGQVSASWTAVVGAGAYNVTCSSLSNTALAGSVSANPALTGLTPGVTYNCGVSAGNAGGFSPDSGLVPVTVQ